MDSNHPDFADEQEVSTTPAKPPAWVSFVGEVLQTLIMAIILYFLIDMVVGRVRVENISMQPTLQEGEFILVNKMAYRLGDFQRGDVVIFHFPKDPGEDYIKRVIGLPGDMIVIENGQVQVNGQVLDEPYIADPPDYETNLTVPADQIFVLGDNRNRSSDSHSWGFVPIDMVVGKALVVYWPLENLKILNEVPGVNAADNR